MGNKNCTNTIGVFFEIGNIWKKIINAWILVFGYELKTCINNEYVIASLDYAHIPTDFFNTSKWDDTYRI